VKLKKKNSDKLKEECGVFGILNNKDAATLTALGLHSLQHRGQESSGIITSDGKKFYSERRLGLVGDNFTKGKVLNRLPGNCAIGHNRYSTAGNNLIKNVQPFFADLHVGGIAIAHNGNLSNARYLRKELVKNGSIFQTTSDTETIVQLIAKSKRTNVIDKIIDSLITIKKLHEQIENIQEIILQNFEPKPDTSMKDHPSTPQQYFKRIVAIARIILPEMNIQIPPNLSPANYNDFLDVGINDWGGISPITVDYVNPEFAWPQINTLENKCAEQSFELKARFPVYPKFIKMINPNLKEKIEKLSDDENYVRREFWR